MDANLRRVSVPVLTFPASRSGALARWEAFQPLVPAYGAKRNLVAPGHPHVSRLSPAIRSRLVTEDEITASLLAKHPASVAQKFLQEIFWRRYWKGWLETRPAVWRDYADRLEALKGTLHEVVRQRADEVMAGRSGVAIMDRFARELVETGYLHNHARMWWASFWIHVERLPWEVGADFFLRHLLDADAASNTLNWRWVAGLQTKDKPYLVSRANLEQCCAPELLADTTGLERLDEKKVRATVFDLVGPDAPTPTPEASRFATYPTKPAQLAERSGLWIHEEDLTPEIGELHEAAFVAAAAFTSAAEDGTASLGAPRRRHRDASFADAVERAGEHFGCTAEMLPAPTLAEGLAAWAVKERLAAVVAYAPAVGPLNDRLEAVRAALTAAGVELVLCRRPTDFQLWPYARGGYFGFMGQAEKWLKAQTKAQAKVRAATAG